MLLGQNLSRPNSFYPSPSLRKAHNRPSVPRRAAQRPNTIDPRVTPETEFVKNSHPNRIHPLFNFSLTIARSSLVRDKIVRSPPRLRFSARSPINSDQCPSIFLPQISNHRRRTSSSLCRFAASRAQSSHGKASLATSTIVGRENGTVASPWVLVIDQE
jgi:hypothetical protein